MRRDSFDLRGKNRPAMSSTRATPGLRRAGAEVSRRGSFGSGFNNKIAENGERVGS